MTTPIATARRAWEALAKGHKSGDFSMFLEMLTDDYTFYMPVGEFRGRNVGRECAAELYKQISAAKPELTFAEPLRICIGGNTVVFEFEDAGNLAGAPYRNRIAASFDVRGEQVCGYREYFGELDLDALTKMAQMSELQS